MKQMGQNGSAMDADWETVLSFWVRSPASSFTRMRKAGLANFAIQPQEKVRRTLN